MEDLDVNGRTINMWLCHLYPLNFASLCTDIELWMFIQAMPVLSG